MKPGRLVVCLAGRFAGKKAVILRVNEDGSKDKKFGHALVVGLSRYPRKVTKRMNQLKIRKRTCVKAFVKFVNLNHVMPTRLFNYYIYLVDTDSKRLLLRISVSVSMKRTLRHPKIERRSESLSVYTWLKSTGTYPLET